MSQSRQAAAAMLSFAASTAATCSAIFLMRASGRDADRSVSPLISDAHKWRRQACVFDIITSVSEEKAKINCLIKSDRSCRCRGHVVAALRNVP